MRRLALVALPLAATLATLAVPLIARAQLLMHESFETDGQGSRYTASQPFNTNGRETGTYWDRGNVEDFNTLLPYANPHGSFFWAGEDVDFEYSGGNPNDGNGSPVQTIDFDTIDILGATGLEFSGLFASTANDYFGPGFPFHEADDGITVLYSIDGGLFVAGLCFSRDASSNLRHDSACDGVGEGNLLTADFFGGGNPYSFAIPGGSSLDLRIEFKADEASEEIAFDSFQVMPEPGRVASLACGSIALALLARGRARRVPSSVEHRPPSGPVG